jgi:hypothetical protein
MTSNGRGGGGGGGAYACSTLTVTPGTSYSISVGSGGASAGNGGASNFRLGATTLVSAAGGSGVSNNTSTGANGGAAGSSTGFIRYSGGNGGDSPSGNSGGGGGAAGFYGNGGAGSNTAAGTANGPSSGNGGAPQSSTNAAGNNGSNYGGGGSGARRTSGTRAGGVGGAGYVTITPMLWFNPITGTNPNTSNPYNTGSLTVTGITATGIGRAAALTSVNSNDRFNASGYPSGGLDLNEYLELTLSADNGNQINFNSIYFTLEKSATGPVQFAVRSSVNNYGSNITTFSAAANVADTRGVFVDLSGAAYQGLTGTVRFRIYGYNAPAAAGTASINDFVFNGAVSPAPYISSFSPSSGCSAGGTSVVITGMNLATASTVKFNGIVSTFTVNSATQITATLPAGASTGPIQISTSEGLATSASNFTVNASAAQPGAFTASTATVCPGTNNVTYTVPLVAGVTYNWTYSGTGASISGSGNSITVSFSNTATSGNLSVTASNSCGTSAARSTAITVSALPSPVITPNYCLAGGLVRLTASGGGTYLWSTGSNATFIEVDQAGTYGLTVTNANGCSASTSIAVATELVTNGNFNAGNVGFTTAYTYVADDASQVEMYPEGTYAVVPNANDVHNLFYGTERNGGTGNIMVVNGHPALGMAVWNQNSIAVQPNTTYYFSAWAMSVVNGNNAVLQFSINGMQVGTVAYLPDGYTSSSGPYNWVRFYGSWNSGFSTSANLSILNLNTVLGGNDFALDDISFGTLAPVALSATPTANNGLPVCSGSELSLQGNASGGASPFSYSWTGPSGFTASTLNPVVQASASSAHSGTYNVTVTDAFGCTVTQSLSVTVADNPANRSLSVPVSPVCSGTAADIAVGSSETGVLYQLVNNSTNTDVGIAANGNGGTTYLNTGALSSATTYRVEAMDVVSGCSATMVGLVTVSVTETPELEITNQAACSGTVNLTLPAVSAGSTGSGSLSYFTSTTATQTLYSEDFSSQEGKGATGIGAVENLSGVSWMLDMSQASFNAATDWFKVVSGVMEGRDMSGQASWISPVIGIGGYTGVQFSLSATEVGTLEATDFVMVEYRINGGTWNLATTNGSLFDDFTSATVSQTGLIGTTLQLRVTVSNNATDEYYRFDNVLVQGSGRTSYATPTAATSGTYYIMSSSGICYDLEPVTVVISATPSAAFTYAAASYCSNGTNPVASITGSAGVFTASPSGLVFANANLGEVDLDLSAPGTYTITNTVSPAGACTPVSQNRSITITAAPVATFEYPGNNLCQSINDAPVLPTYLNGGAAGSFNASSSNLSLNSSTGAIDIGASLPGNYAVINTRAAVGACVAMRDTAFIAINPYTFTGSVSSSSSSAEICNGQSVTLLSNGTAYLSAAHSQSFNDAFNDYSRSNTSVGGTVANAAWTLRSSGYSTNGETFSTTDNSQFYLTSSYDQNGTSTQSILQTPMLSTVGYTSLNLEFRQYYNHNTSTARVEVSTNGTTWTTVASYSATIGSASSFSTTTINLVGYVNQPVLYVRFRYNSTGRRRYWAIDNVTLSGNTSNYDFQWASNPLGYAANQQNPVLSPTSDAFYFVTATNSYGCSLTNSPIPVAVKPLPSLSSTLTPPAVCSGAAFSYNPVLSPAGATATWTRPAVANISNAAIASPQSGGPNESLNHTGASTTNVHYTFIANYNGCQNSQIVTVPVHPKPTVNSGSSLTVCNGSGTTLNPAVNGGSGSYTFSWSPIDGLSDPTIANPIANPSVASRTYTLTVTDANGCSESGSGITITNAGFGGTPGKWLGSQNTNWHTCLNWEDGRIPTAATAVTLSDGMVNDLEITGMAECASLLIQGSGSQDMHLNIKNSGQLVVAGELFINKTNGSGEIEVELEDQAILQCGNLRVAGSSFGAQNARFKREDASTSLVINGDFIVSSGAYVQLGDLNQATLDGAVQVKGSMTLTADSTDFLADNATLLFNGSGDQYFNVSNLPRLNYLHIQKPSGKVILDDNVHVYKQLNLTQGLLDLNGHMLTLGSTSAPGTIAGGNSNSYILAWNGATNGTVRHLVPQTDVSYVFPVGDNSRYSPFELLLDNATLSNAYLDLQLHGTTHPAMGTSTIYLNRYWSVEPSGISNPLYNVEFGYDPADVTGADALLFPAKYHNGSWQSCIESMSNAQVGNGFVNTSSRTLSWTGLNSFSEFTGIGNGTALPIELLDFSATPENQMVRLNWITASEINNSHFTLERSTDAQHFESIGTVQGAGNSSTIHRYESFDKAPLLGTSYYRLKQTDFNGSFTYSQTVAVQFEGSECSEIQSLVARPNDGILDIQCLNPKGMTAQIDILDASGKSIYSTSGQTAPENWNLQITGLQLSRGTYFLRIRMHDQLLHRKFMY